MRTPARLRLAATVLAATAMTVLSALPPTAAAAPSAIARGATGAAPPVTAQEAAPRAAHRAGFTYFECRDAYHCAIPFLQPQGESVVYNIEVTGGVRQLVAVSVDMTLNIPGCHPTIYPGEYHHFSCFDGPNMGGKMVLRAWAGDKHNFRIGIWLP